MTRLLSLLTATALLPLSAVAAPNIPKAEYKLEMTDFNPAVRDFIFPSGLRVIFQEEHSQPVVSIFALIDAGSEMDQPDHDGIAHALEHLAFRAQHGDLPKNWDFIHQLGASINAYTNVDETFYATIAPVDSLIPLLQIEAMRLVDGGANVTDADVNAEKSIVSNELRQSYEQGPVGDAWDELSRQAFTPEWTYYTSTIGSHDTIKNIDLADVQELFDNYYTPENTTMVVVGDFKLEDTRDIIDKVFGTLPQLLADPDNPDAPLEAVDPKPRNVCAENREPPAPNPDPTPPHVKGMVDEETVVVGWSLPPGYCGDDLLYRFMANQLTTYIYRTLVPDWDWSDPEAEIPGVGCFPSMGHNASMMYCFIEPSGSGGYRGDDLIDKAADALFLQWAQVNYEHDPDLYGLKKKAYEEAKMSVMASILQGVDETVSPGVFGGRGMNIALHAHYMGSPNYFSESFNTINAIDPNRLKELSSKYITRERMVSAVIETMDREERLLREARAGLGEGKEEGWSGAADKEYDFAFDTATLTPEVIRRVTVTPSIENIHRFTLENGLRVAVMPYGDAPIVNVGLKIGGSDLTAPIWGLDSFAESLHRRGTNLDERVMAVAGDYWEESGTTSSVMRVVGANGSLDALLHTLRYNTTDIDWRMANKSPMIKSWRSRYRKNSDDEPDVWATRITYERQFPDHPLGYWENPAYWEAVDKWDLTMVKDWIHRKYQPANAQLVIVGNVDSQAAEASVRKYFGGWEAEAGVETGPVSSMPRPELQPERQVLIFDVPESTQTRVSLGCHLNWKDDSQDAAAHVLADVLDEQAWRKLREEAGKTYGAGAYARDWAGGANTLGMYTLVQNDAVGLAVNTFFSLLETMASGEIDEKSVITQKWSRGRRYVLGHQSSDAMVGRLFNQNIDELEDMDAYADSLSEVEGSQFGPLLETCSGHEVVTIAGPREYAEAQLTELGISYEVFDWETLYLGTLTQKELKKRAKALKKKEKAEAKEAAKAG